MQTQSKVIGIEELDEDEMITEEEVNAAKEKIAKEPRRTYGSDTIVEKKPVSRPVPSSSAPEKRFSVANTSALSWCSLSRRPLKSALSWWTA